MLKSQTTASEENHGYLYLKGDLLQIKVLKYE